eukprot:s155_g12.t1
MLARSSPQSQGMRSYADALMQASLSMHFPKDCLALLRTRPEDLYLADTPRCYQQGAFTDGHFHGKLLPCGWQAGGMPLAMAEGLSWWK